MPKPKPTNLRARLEAIAAGKKRSDRADVLQPGEIEKHEAAFGAWQRFSQIGGEPLAAPSELLPPLP